MFSKILSYKNTIKGNKTNNNGQKNRPNPADSSYPLRAAHKREINYAKKLTTKKLKLKRGKVKRPPTTSTGGTELRAHIPKKAEHNLQIPLFGGVHGWLGA